MENQFYQPFDLEFAGVGYPRNSDDRSIFQVDRDRILYTQAFRRLQNKTQVFLAGEYDLYRTRLTHSLEVAQIGRSICQHLRQSSPILSAGFYIDSDLVEAICLAHDLGHPPFGHGGERTLHALMRPYGGFEGNAQTLRMLAETIYQDARTGGQTGMKPSRALLDGILKYKTLFSETPNAQNHFIYDSQRQWLEFVFAGSLDTLLSIPAGKERNSVRSIECQIMDWADDTAYSLNDIVDGIHIGFITIEKIERWASQQSHNGSQVACVDKLLCSIREQRTEPSLGGKIGRFIKAVSLVENDHPLASLSRRYAFRLRIDPVIREEADVYKKLALDIVFQSPQLQQLDYKGDHIIRSLFTLMSRCYLEKHEVGELTWHLLPLPVEELLSQQTLPSERARLLCDYLANLTDGAATRMYQRLFDADFGSIVDLI